MDINEILHHTDHTLLSADAGWDDIRTAVDDAVSFGAAACCIPPSFVERAANFSAGRVPVCTVIGFACGYNTTETKVFEAMDALSKGADELDMVINVGWVKDARPDLVEEEILRVRRASEGHVLKVIVETCLLTKEEKIELCRVVTDAGADYIKTSTGFSTGGATFEDVALFREHLGRNVKIKAAGGIKSPEDAWHFLELGADRLGTSRIIKILKEKGAGSF